MSEVENVISKSLRDIGDRISDTIRNKGLEYTGASQEFEINYEGNKIQLLGMPYLEYLDRGRGPNRDQSERGLRNWSLWYGEKVLKPWAEKKGLIFSNYFGLAYHIATTGNRIFKDKSKGIELDKILGRNPAKIFFFTPLSVTTGFVFNVKLISLKMF